jgi:NADP-reducing hydrogenase subunit HndB
MGETMPRIKIEDLDKIAERVRRATFLRDGAGKAKITVHMGTCGIAAGARGIMSALLEEFEKQDIKDVILTSSGCAGLCSREPMATVELKGEAPIKYVDLTPDKIRQILNEHVLGGKVVEEYVFAKGSERVS